MRKRNLFILSIVTGLLLTTLLSFGTNAFTAKAMIISYNDDFSTDSGLWQYVGTAYRDSTNQYLVLTEPINYQSAVVFFKLPISSDFTAIFDYKLGGGSGADGFTLFFYKQKYSSLDYGGSLAFSTLEGSVREAVSGYGVEFDNWQNTAEDFKQIIGSQPNTPSDPSSNHIALIQDFAGNHLAYVDDPRTEDNEWHRVTVTVDESSVTVVVDEVQVLQWNGVIDRAFDCLGFSAGTGGKNNRQIIDNFSVEATPPFTQEVPEVPFGTLVASSSIIVAALIYFTLIKRRTEPKLDR